ncbi:hypothetical protein SKAU_G00303900 [Synaphobranchus kaupii]|uniref:Uncharacterized protein n=1 Tax=Synaphobranchus kaupii TaxID=118154 RepID=A0A9Q1IMK7_SYNKA|nr:hypothetical protein SKAU_G00303900 [Synaphobranchus kaupii]
MHAAFGTNDKEVTTSILWFQGGLFPVEEANSSLLNDRVVSIELGKTISGLTNNVTIIFFHQNASRENATCVFWDTVKSSSGSKLVWNSAGCSSEQEDGRIICSCDHLSFFAVLLSPVYEKPASASGIATQVSPLLSAYTVWVLTLLTRIGCGVSVCSLALVLTFHAVFRRNNSEHSLSIHIHLCVALFGLNLSFLINDSLASLNVHAACIFIAVATHYTLLCTLIWFAIEGFHLYLLVVRVFNVFIERYLLKLALAGWGLPAVAVISILSSGKYGRYNIYKLEGGTETMCYLPHSVLTILTFSLFVLVILVNVVVYTVVTVQVVRAWHFRTSQQEKRVSKRDIFSLLGVSWLLGMTWGVALFQFGPLKEAAAYMFCIFNTFHGVLLSLRYFTLTY